ncbi:mechanosensitive ion channel family protein [Paracraurococcus ruber]|nr:mechanosensitive ion channel family protein [Paracraurococcus ruber]
MARPPGPGPLILPAALALGGFLLQGAAPRWLPAMAPAHALAALAGALGWLGLAWTGARCFDLLLRRAARATRREAPYPRLLSDLVRALLFAGAAAAIVTQVLGQPALGLVTTSSVAVAVIGFALRNIISDLFSGLALGVDAPYRIGDWIETTEGSAGRVAEIGWRATRLVTRDGVAVTVPNGLIAAHRLLNYGAAARYRIALRIALDPAVPEARAKRILLAAALEAERRYPGLRPDVLLHELAEGAAIYLLRIHVPDYGQEAPCRDAVAAAALRGLQQAGLAPAPPGRRLQVERAAQPPGRAALLARVGLFAGFAEAERAALAAMLVEHALPRGTTVVRQGDSGDSLFLLAEGVLEVRALQDGAEMAPDRMGPGAIFGEMSLLTGQPRSATVTAETDCLVMELRRQDLDPVLRRRPELAESLAAIMASRRARNAVAGPAETADTAPPPGQADLLGRLRAFFRLD